MRKGQIKLVESVFVIIIFMIILVIAIVFFSRFQRSESQFQDTQESLRQSVQMAQRFASLPEVACTENNAIRRNCVDLMKLENMDKLSTNEMVYYYDLFRYGTVTIEKLFPEGDADSGNKWVIYNNTRDDMGFFSMGIPMSIYNPETRQRYFGLMEVVYYVD